MLVVGPICRLLRLDACGRACKIIEANCGGQVGFDLVAQPHQLQTSWFLCQTLFETIFIYALTYQCSMLAMIPWFPNMFVKQVVQKYLGYTPSMFFFALSLTWNTIQPNMAKQIFFLLSHAKFWENGQVLVAVARVVFSFNLCSMLNKAVAPQTPRSPPMTMIGMFNKVFWRTHFSASIACLETCLELHSLSPPAIGHIPKHRALHGTKSSDLKPSDPVP